MSLLVDVNGRRVYPRRESKLGLKFCCGRVTGGGSSLCPANPRIWFQDARYPARQKGRGNSTKPIRSLTRQNVESVVEPGQNHLGRSVLVTTHFAEVNGHTLDRETGPGMKVLFEFLTIADYVSFFIFHGPG